MGKHGPCYHCGVTSTPLWRNGPPEKPVLCNACGSRWRTKGTLVNYTPLHARSDLDDLEDQRVSKIKIISINKNKEVKLLKRKPNHDNVAVGKTFSDYSQGYRKVKDEDTSNRSSSGSAISNSESCAQFGGADASDLTGAAQSVVWDSMVPSRKRTCVGRPKQSSVEKLTKDLYTILHEQQSSYLSGSSEEDLLFESEAPMVSVEIGHGSVLIRHPNSIVREEESEASSLSVDNKSVLVNEAYSRSVTLHVHNNKNKGVDFLSPATEKNKMPSGGLEMQKEQLKRDKYQQEKLQILASRNSSLCNIDLEDVLNFEELVRHLTNEEQQELAKYLPPVDIANFPDSLITMFDSHHFKESMYCFQQLLGEGVFDGSLMGVKTEDCKSLKKLALLNLSKSKWVERYNLLEKCKNSTAACAVAVPNVMESSKFVNAKKSRDGPNRYFPEVKTTMKSPKRVIIKASYENKELVYNDSSCFSPRSLFTLPPESSSSFMLDSFNFADENSDQDLLLDVPSNNSFPQAELLHPTSSFSTSSSSMYPHLYRP